MSRKNKIKDLDRVNIMSWNTFIKKKKSNFCNCIGGGGNKINKKWLNYEWH